MRGGGGREFVEDRKLGFTAVHIARVLGKLFVTDICLIKLVTTIKFRC